MEAENTKYFVNSDGKKVFCKYWHPKLLNNEQPRSAVFICHGAGEHCQRYNDLATVLTDKGMLVFAHDHVGHGLSEGDRVHVDSGNTYIKDILQHIDIVKAGKSDMALFVIGHSMGGLLALKTALDNPSLFTGVVLIGPALVVDPGLASAYMICFAKSLAFMLPQLQTKSIDSQLISRDQNVVKDYVDDPLVWHGGLKIRWGLSLLEFINDVNERLAEVTFPLFIAHGSDDRICLPSGSQQLYDHARSTQKLLKIYPGGYHQVHNEPDGQGKEAVADIVSWISDVFNSSRSG